MNILYWGTFDRTKPRNQVLLSGLGESEHQLEECHFAVWENDNDKSQLNSWQAKLRILLRYALAYPVLLFRYLFVCGKHDVVFVGYLGIVDVIVLWPFAKLKGKPIVLDAFLSVYNTTVEDRALLSKKHPLAKGLFQLERLAYRLSSLVVIDTKEHARYIAKTFDLDESKVGFVFVGAREEFFVERCVTTPAANEPLRLVFYGTLVPLQGVCTIFEAARITPPEVATWTIIGKGQESTKLDALCEEARLPHVERIQWMPLNELQARLDECDLALGIFGATEKAARVIPIKFFEAFAKGLPLITMDSPAIRELIPPKTEGIWLVPPGDAQALSAAVVEASKTLPRLKGQVLYQELKREIRPQTIAARLGERIEQQVFAGGIR